MGNDVFDKLLVLRALKPEFPEALFFTTDFDYTLTMPSERGWTRNLIIASSFGPELHKEIQGEIPPFRSSYESSAFLAAQLAINELNEPSASLVVQGKLTKWLKTARVFEIERSGSVLSFPTNEPPVNESACAANLLNCAQLQPEREDLFPKFEKDRRIILALAARFQRPSR